MKPLFVFVLLSCAALAFAVEEDKAAAEKTDLEGAESQSYGFGYGTKVADKYGVSTGKASQIA